MISHLLFPLDLFTASHTSAIGVGRLANCQVLDRFGIGKYRLATTLGVALELVLGQNGHKVFVERLKSATFDAVCIVVTKLQW